MLNLLIKQNKIFIISIVLLASSLLLYCEEVILVVGGERISKDMPNNVEDCQALIRELSEYYNELDKAYTESISIINGEAENFSTDIEKTSKELENLKDNNQKAVEKTIEKLAKHNNEIAFNVQGFYVSSTFTLSKQYGILANYMYSFKRIFITGGAGLSITNIEPKNYRFSPIFTLGVGVLWR